MRKVVRTVPKPVEEEKVVNKDVPKYGEIWRHNDGSKVLIIDIKGFGTQVITNMFYTEHIAYIKLKGTAYGIRNDKHESWKGWKKLANSLEEYYRNKIEIPF